MTVLLRLTGITRTFPGVKALDDVSLDLRAGEVHAVMGENGAGKSTLMKIAAGVYRADAGTVQIGGQDVVLANPAQATELGLFTVFQELTVLPNLDIAANLMLGREPCRAGGLVLDYRAMHSQAQGVLDRLGIPLNPGTEAARLSAGQRQLVEIARACAQRPRVLVLDEPTSSLGRHEEDLLFSLIARLKADGVGILYITHRMSEVFRLSDRITVLRDGRHVLTADTASLTRADLIRAMVGRVVDESRHRSDTAQLPIALEIAGLSRAPAVADASLTLHAGEVLGIAGLMGSGRTELARLIAGVDRPAAGQMRLFGQAFAPRSVAEAIKAGVIYLSEDRKTEGLHLPLSVADNITLPSLPRLSRAGFVAPATLATLAADWIKRLGVKTASAQVAVNTLSGGNQQKVALAKWLALSPRVILLDEPTRGVDVGAKAEIYALIRRLAADGAAVLVISSELPEVLQLSDRILVMARGRITGIVPASEATEESLLTLAFAEAGQAA